MNHDLPDKPGFDASNGDLIGRSGNRIPRARVEYGRALGAKTTGAQATLQKIGLSQRIVHVINEDILKKSQDEMAHEIRELIQVCITIAKDPTQAASDRVKAAHTGLVWLCGLPKQRVELKQTVDIGLRAASSAVRELKLVKELNNQFVDELSELDDPLLVIDDQPAVESVPPERDGAPALPE